MSVESQRTRWTFVGDNEEMKKDLKFNVSCTKFAASAATYYIPDCEHLSGYLFK